MRVLVADDDPLVRQVLCALVRAFGYSVQAAEDGLEAWEIIQAEPITLLISDWQMPRLDGPALIRQIRAAGLPRYVSCLLLTVRDQRTDRIHGLDAGADDYLVKPVDPDELRARLAVIARMLRLEQDLRDSNARLQQLAEQLRHQAAHDALTGLLNRQGLQSQAARELARAERAGQPLAALLLDIDHFKQVNDQHGHAVGDQALAHVAALLHAALRPYDLVGRWGGEEFLLLLPNTTPAAACAIAERVRTRIAATPLVIANQRMITLQASIGIAGCFAGAPDLDTLVAAADQALYAAKAAGRNRVCGPEASDASND
jgi:two-component system, cell cycle response regulator